MCRDLVPRKQMRTFLAEAFLVRDQWVVGLGGQQKEDANVVFPERQTRNTT